MAKVKPGPVVSSVRGSIGPVTYYEVFGKQVVRARVRPHQKISSKRYWNRLRWRNLMAYWHAEYTHLKYMYYVPARSLHMHMVNLFMHLNAPYTWPLNRLAIQDLSHHNLLTVRRLPDPIFDRFHVTWDPSKLLWIGCLLGWSLNEDPTLNYGPMPHYYNDGDWEFWTVKRPDPWLYLYVYASNHPTNWHYFRGRIADIPFE